MENKTNSLKANGDINELIKLHRTMFVHLVGIRFYSLQHNQHKYTIMLLWCILIK